ncbi:MAG: DUF4399 domain-containing protein [Gemmatimonadota bacterium]
MNPCRLPIPALLLTAGALACATAESGPRVEIVSPANESEAGADVLVQLRVTGAMTVPADGSRREGEGHHHLFVNVDPTHADSIIPRTAGTHHLGTGADTIRVTGLPPGRHRLIAVFAYGDHVPIRAVAADTAFVTVR